MRLEADTDLPRSEPLMYRSWTRLAEIVYNSRLVFCWRTDRQSGFGAPANLADWPRQGSNPGPTGLGFRGVATEDVV